MRWVDRGPKPDGVDGYARQFTQGWVDHFRNDIGGRPTDSYWREFRPRLGMQSDGNCWYCERRCEPASEVGGKAATVDHFKPRSRFPELTYEWTNWVFSCRRCNEDSKGDRWPAVGYVDPGAVGECERPERYFAYDMLTGEIVPHPNMKGDGKERAESTINDLGLNQIDVRFYRLDWTRQFVEDLRTLPPQDREALIGFVFGRPMEYVGCTAMAVAQLRESGEI